MWLNFMEWQRRLKLLCNLLEWVFLTLCMAGAVLAVAGLWAFALWAAFVFGRNVLASY